MGGYDTNDALVRHIWDSLVQDGYENTIEQEYRENELISRLHNDPLPHEEKISRQEQDVNREVMQRMQDGRRSKEGNPENTSHHLDNTIHI